MHRYLIIYLLLLSSLASFAQKEIDYNPRVLSKAIRKLNKSEEQKLNEILLPESIAKQFPVNGKYFLVTDSLSSDNIKYVYIGRVNSCREGGCSLHMTPSQDDGFEYFDYFILYDSAITVQHVKVYNYQATHGHEVSAKGWLKQFIGYEYNKTLEVGKNVDAISGATISVYGITGDIELKTGILVDIIK